MFDNYNGYLVINSTYSYNNSGYLVNGNGELIQTVGWYRFKEFNNLWYYIQEDASVKYGFLEDGGYTYYMTPYMLTWV